MHQNKPNLLAPCNLLKYKSNGKITACGALISDSLSWVTEERCYSVNLINV